jgi:hypothetical protein
MSRPETPPELKRVSLSTTIAPKSAEFLNDQPESLGRTIDKLVENYIDSLLREEE